MTSVINEGNSYEFPSADLHKAILNKLILNDTVFKRFFLHIKKEYQQEEKAIRSSHSDFARTMNEFVNKVEKDITKNLINVDHYMRDLKKHALSE